MISQILLTLELHTMSSFSLNLVDLHDNDRLAYHDT